jgi:hypothetical protein
MCCGPNPAESYVSSANDDLSTALRYARTQPHSHLDANTFPDRHFHTQPLSYSDRDRDSRGHPHGQPQPDC